PGDSSPTGWPRRQLADGLAPATTRRRAGPGDNSPTGWPRRQLADGLAPATLTLAGRLGTVVREARVAHGDPVAAGAMLDGILLLTGKVADVIRTEGGFARGHARVDGTGGDAGRVLELGLQKEHLMATRDGVAVAATPALICVLDSETGAPVT
ncbi:hypothetical protein AB0E78_34395, partial [Streptomyces sp. NPDC032198]